MTKKQVIRLFSYLSLAVQLGVGLWQLIKHQQRVSYERANDPGNRESILDSLQSLIYGAIADLFWVGPILVVTVCFMFWDKNNRTAYLPDIAMQLVSLAGIPILFSLIISSIAS